MSEIAEGPKIKWLPKNFPQYPPDPNSIQFTSRCDINTAYAVTIAKMTSLADACSFYSINNFLQAGIVRGYKNKI